MQCCKWCRYGFRMWFNGRSEEHMLTWLFHWERCTRLWVLWCVNRTAPKSLRKHTGAGVCVCVYASWSITTELICPYGLPDAGAGRWSRSIHSHPSGVFCSHHGVPSLLVTHLLWSANQIKRRRSQRTNRQHRMCYFFPLSLSFYVFVCIFPHLVKPFNTLWKISA